MNLQKPSFYAFPNLHLYGTWAKFLLKVVEWRGGMVLWFFFVVLFQKVAKR